MENIVKDQRNLIKNNYLSSTCNHSICLDITDLGKNGHLFLAVDIASRSVVTHQYNELPFQVQDVIQTMEIAFKHRAFLPKLKIVHTDRGSIFKNLPYQNFMEKLDILISRGSAKAHDNQIVERTIQSLKGLIRPLIDQNWKPPKRKMTTKVPFASIDPIKIMRVPPKRMKDVVNQAINEYNNREHGGIHRMTPTSMENALFRHYKDKEQISKDNYSVNDVPALTKNVQSTEASRVRQDQAEAIVKYATQIKVLPNQGEQPNLHNFICSCFDQLIRVTERQTNQVIQKIEAERQDLYESNLQLQEMLHQIKEETDKQRVARESHEERKNKRKNALKVPVRETIDEEEFWQILDIVKSSNFVGARKKCAMIIMYLTGMRVSNLLLLTVRHVKEFINKGETNLPLIKKGPKRFFIKISDKGREIIKQKYPLFYTLMINKEDDMPFFTTQVCFNKPIDRTSLEKELNAVLTKASHIFKKHIRTHSFRATLITNYLERVPIDVVRDVVGHRDIKTTALYKRSKLSQDQFKNVLKELDKTMFRIRSQEEE